MQIRLCKCDECKYTVKDQVDMITGKSFCSNWKQDVDWGCFYGMIKDRYPDKEINEEEQAVLNYLENTFSGAKMVGDLIIMIRVERAIAAFMSNPFDSPYEIFTEQFINTIFETDCFAEHFNKQEGVGLND